MFRAQKFLGFIPIFQKKYEGKAVYPLALFSRYTLHCRVSFPLLGYTLTELNQLCPYYLCHIMLGETAYSINSLDLSEKNFTYSVVLTTASLYPKPGVSYQIRLLPLIMSLSAPFEGESRVHCKYNTII